VITQVVWAAIIWGFAHASGPRTGTPAAAEGITNKYALMLVRDVRDAGAQNFTFSVSEWGNSPTNFVVTNSLSIVGRLHDGQGFTIAVHDSATTQSR
jgi:hypothetical protein